MNKNTPHSTSTEYHYKQGESIKLYLVYILQKRLQSVIWNFPNTLGLGTIRINKSNADSMSSVKKKFVVLQLTKVGKN